MVEIWPLHILIYCNQCSPFPVVKACDKSFLYRCKSQSCYIFISVTHPNLWPKLQHYIPIFGLVMLPKWRPRYMGFMQLDHPIAGYRAMWHRLTQFEGVKAIPSLLVIVTSVFGPKLQHNISIFGLVMVETWPPVYMNYCKQYIPSQVAESPCSRLTASCKSQSCCIFIGATPSLFGPNCSITSQYLA